MQEDEIVLRLLRNIMGNLSYMMNRCYEPYGITGVQFLVLMEIAASEQEVKVKDLAKRLMMSNSNLSAILKRLEAHMLVERKRSQCDDRVVIVSLTRKSKQCVEELRNKDHRFPFMEPFDQIQKDQIIESLRMLDQAIKEANKNEKSK